MSELRLHVDTLESALHSSDLTLSDSVQRAAAAYLEACRQVNERLAQCEDQVRKGFRSEALRLAKMEPDLLELYGELNFPGRDAWDERAMLLNLEIPPRLNHRVAELLDRAFLEEQSLGDLLQTFRHQALSRAPIQKRLGTLRLIAQAEPANAAWQDDIEAYEDVRQNELRNELKKLHKEINWPLARNLMDEVKNTTWVSPVPLDLSEDLTREFRRQSRMDGQTQLIRLKKQLEDAASKLDFDACRRIRDNIFKMADERGIGRIDPVLHPVRPQLDWLADQEKEQKQRRQFSAAVDELLRAIHEKADVEIVKQLHEKALNFGYLLPDDAEYQFRRYVGADKRKQLMYILLCVGLIGGFALILGVIVLFAYLK
ncbi:MAG TPA: hypothetical protein VGZ47_03000 [Gemmataceae bacterium]|jgi:hypothetical protein|nr:hypothetical protein [Gemmataceae bacterium]